MRDASADPADPAGASRTDSANSADRAAGANRANPAAQPTSSSSAVRTLKHHDAVTMRAMRRATSVAYLWLALGGGALVVIGVAIALYGTSFGPGLPIAGIGLLALTVGIVGYSRYRQG